MLRAGLATTALAALLAGCGGHEAARATTAAQAPTSASATPVCHSLAVAAVDDARALARAFGGQASPGDLAMYDLREHLAYLQSNRCAPELLGEALTRSAPPRELARLDLVLPASYVLDVHQALACASDKRSAERCVVAAAAITLPGEGKQRGTSHPMTP